MILCREHAETNVLALGHEHAETYSAWLLPARGSGARLRQTM